MISDLYSGQLLEAAGAIPPASHLPDADGTARRTSRVCGSEVELDLALRGGVVSEVATRVKACALGQAAVSLFDRNVRGATPAEIRQLRGEMSAMLREGGPPPEGARWAALAQLAPVADYPARHASVMLVFEAAVAALDQAEARRG